MRATEFSTVLWTILLFIAVFLVGVPAQAKYGGGSGEPNDPYPIAATEELMLPDIVGSPAQRLLGEEGFPEKLIHPRLIINPLEQGRQTVRVIVNLHDPLQVVAEDGELMQAPSAFYTNVMAIKTSVLSTFSPKELKLRHRFSDLAAFSAEVTPAGLAELLNEPMVESIEPVEEYHFLVAQGVALIGGIVYRSQYGGDGTAVAVIDSGIDYRHPMLGGGNFPNDKVIGGYDTGEHDADPYPMMNNGVCSGEHGTACAGIIAGNAGGPYPFIGGVAPRAKLYALKVAEPGDDGKKVTYEDAVTEAILWCVDHQYDDPNHPIVAINISLGAKRYFGPCDESESRANVSAINRAVAAGIAVIGGSGNDGYCDSMGACACLTNVISVGAVFDDYLGQVGACVDRESCVAYACSNCSSGWCCQVSAVPDKVVCYSNTAPFLDLLAPSHNAYTTDISGPLGASTGDYYANFGGTSAAAPYVAGAVACLQSAAKALKGRHLTALEVRITLTSTGDPVIDQRPSPPITTPRVNLARAIESIMANRGTTIVFHDTFSPCRIDSDKWIESEGATVDDLGLAEPSPDCSLRLNGHPNGNDYVTSVTIDLSPFSSATLTYWYERTGGGDAPDPNDDLILEYDAGSGWQELSRQPGEGPAMTEYEKVEIELPSDTLTAVFRLRIRSIGLRTASRVFDDWFVDDVMIVGRTDLPELPIPVIEGFETRDFSTFNWQHSGDSFWWVTSDEAYSGLYSARAGAIDDSGTSTLKLIRDCSAGVIHFFVKTSSEAGYDELIFRVDSEVLGRWSGRTDWTQATFAVSGGTHTFDWSYTKDGSMTEGDDTAWLDDVEF
jgi:subtilisin family serine protease